MKIPLKVCPELKISESAVSAENQLVMRLPLMTFQIPRNNYFHIGHYSVRFPVIVSAIFSKISRERLRN